MDFDFLEKWFADSIGLENDSDLRHFIWLDRSIHRNVRNRSRWVTVQNSFSDALDEVLDWEVANVLYAECFLGILIE